MQAHKHHIVTACKQIFWGLAVQPNTLTEEREFDMLQPVNQKHTHMQGVIPASEAGACWQAHCHLHQVCLSSIWLCRQCLQITYSDSSKAGKGNAMMSHAGTTPSLGLSGTTAGTGKNGCRHIAGANRSIDKGITCRKEA